MPEQQRRQRVPRPRSQSARHAEDANRYRPLLSTLLAATTIDRRLSTVCDFYGVAHIDGRFVKASTALRDELLNVEEFASLLEAEIVVDGQRTE